MNQANEPFGTDVRSYVPPVQIGEVMRGAIIGKIVASKSAEFKVGEYCTASPGWTEYAILKESEVKKLDVPSNGKVTDALGVLGAFFFRNSTQSLSNGADFVQA